MEASREALHVVQGLRLAQSWFLGLHLRVVC